MIEDSAPPAAAPPAAKRRLWTVLRLSVTVAAFAYLLSIVDLAELGSAVAALPWHAFALAVVIAYLAVAIGALRWGILLRACGASVELPFGHLYRLYLVGMFYNHFAPGAIGGDIVRGVATARCFGRGGVTSGVAITMLERATGFAGLLIIFAGASWARPIKGMEELNRWAALGGLAAAGGIVALVTARRLARFLPGPLGRFVERLPRLRSVGGLVMALMLSLLTHASMTAMTHVLAVSVVPALRWRDSFLVTPIGMLASYFPLTVGGAGAREATFVALYPLVGVDEATALATSLAWWGATLVMAASGGALNALAPLRTDLPV